MLVGPSLILLNKYILKNLAFPYPLFLSGLGVLFSAVFAQIIVKLGITTLSKKEQVEGILWYRRVLPVGFAHAMTLGTLVCHMYSCDLAYTRASFGKLCLLTA